MRPRLLLCVIFLVGIFPALGHAAPTPEGGACVADAECTSGTICDGGFCTKPSSGARIVPPFYFQKKGSSGYQDITPLLWFHHWNRDKDTQVQFPFFYRTEDKKTKESTTITLPFFWWNKSATSSTFVAPLLLSGFSRDDKTGESWHVTFPVLFEHRTRDSHWTLAPLTFFASSPGSSASVVFPFYWRIRSPGHATTVAFPLFWRIQDKPLGYDHILFLPFVDYQSDSHGRHTRVASLLGGWERDDDAGLKQGLLLVPPIFFRKDPQRTALVVPPLAAYWKVRADGSTGFIAGPFFHSRDPEGSTSGFFPLYWRWHDNKTGATTHWLFPIAGFHSRPDARGGYVGPVYGWRSTKGWGAGLAPLFFFGRNGTRHHAMVLPLFARFSDDKDGSSTTATPLVYVHRSPDGWDAGVFPLVFAGRHNDKTYGTLAPIYWHFGQKNGATDIVGPFYFQHGKEGWLAGLAPLVFFGNKGGQEHQVLGPLLFFRFIDHKHDSEHTLAGPFYHQRKGDESVDVAFPLGFSKHSPNHDLEVTLLGGRKRDFDDVTEVYGPYIHQKTKTSSTHFLFPLGAIHDAPGYHLVVQFPFFWRVHEGDETDTVVFPFYWRVRSPRMQFDGFFPLFLHAKNQTATTTVAGPIWNRTRKDGGRSLGLFPLFAYGSNEKDGKSARYFGMPGIFWHDNQRTLSSELLVGPFYDIRRANGYDAGLPPILFAWRRGTVSHVITPIFYRERDTAADTSFNFFGPLYWGNTGPEKRFGLFPLLFVKTRPDGNTVGIFPLLYAKTKPHGSIGVTALGGWSKYEKGWRAWFGPFYARRDNEVSSTAFWPLLYFSRDKQTGSTVKMALPLYFDGRDKNGRELQVMTPLIWRYHSVERTITVGVPFYFDVHSFGESRTTGFLPFFLRNKSQVDQTVSYTVPALLFWARKRPNGPDPGSDAVWFPLVWHFGGKDSSTTVVAPLVWDFKRGESRTTLGLPVFAYWKRPDAKRLVVFNMYYRRGINAQEGSWHCYIVPFADFGRARKQDVEWNVLMGLVGYSRAGKQRKLKLFWLWDVPLQDVPASNLSWFGSTPSSARTEL